MNITQVELAQQLGITPITLRKYEQDENPILSDKIEQLIKLDFDAVFIITGKSGNVTAFKIILYRQKTEFI